MTRLSFKRDDEKEADVRPTLFYGLALPAVLAAMTGCGAASSAATSDEATMQKDAALYQIDQIEATWHKAASHHDVNLMMTLWAPGAVFNIGGQSYTGKAQIRKFFQTDNKAFMVTNHWESDTPSYKIKATVNGNKGTLYFQCHYVDIKTSKVVSVVGVDHDVQKIDGKWLIVNSAGATASLGP